MFLTKKQDDDEVDEMFKLVVDYLVNEKKCIVYVEPSVKSKHKDMQFLNTYSEGLIDHSFH